MTHAMLNKNAASSRAIPIEKMISDVRHNPVVPARWGRNQKGMQSDNWLNTEESERATNRWLYILEGVIKGVEGLDEEDHVHKQWANRPLEAWMHMTTLITGTEWPNFFNLRAHPDAHPDLQQLAYRALHCYDKHVPNPLGWGEWHVPFGDRMPDGLSAEDQIKVATARAARLSYMTFENEINVAKDLELHDRLLASKHLSPFGHPAKAESSKPAEWGELVEFANNDDLATREREYLQDLISRLDKNVKRDQGNLRGWTPYRKQFAGENQTVLDIPTIMARKPDWVTLE